MTQFVINRDASCATGYTNDAKDDKLRSENKGRSMTDHNKEIN
jgi:hypothetical protein